MLVADEQPPKTINHPKSNCIVEASGGHYPLFKVKKEKKIIYSPKSDGIGGVTFSPSGEYIMFPGSEINWVDIGDKSFSIVVLNCNSGELRGFIGGFPSGASWIDNETIKYTDTASEKAITVKLILKANKSFQLTRQTSSSN